MGVCLLESAGRPLKAPSKEDMARAIRENASCRAFYRFCKGKKTLFAFETDRVFGTEYFPDCTIRKLTRSESTIILSALLLL